MTRWRTRHASHGDKKASLGDGFKVARKGLKQEDNVFESRVMKNRKILRVADQCSRVLEILRVSR